MRHYFVESKHNEDEYFTFEKTFKDKKFTFRSCPDVFSKNELDYGSLVLVDNIIERADLFGGKIMDMCCGYGTIGILMSKFVDAEYYLSDINGTAVELAKHNAKINQTNINPENIFVGNLFENFHDCVHHVVSNPPIKVGKKVLLEFVNGTYSHLLENGTLTLVIKKNLGADSLKKYLANLFGNCTVWDRDKGYYILHSVKTREKACE